jgi:hypothetical protein
VEINWKGQEGRGEVQDISAVGARIERADLVPSEGSRILLKVRLYENAVPLGLESQVVRLTESGGFCVAFTNADPRIERVLRTVLPKIAAHRLPDTDEDSEWSGQIQLQIGSELHEEIAALASAQGMEAADWVRSLIEKSASDARRAQTHAHATEEAGHDPKTCPDCMSKAASP